MFRVPPILAAEMFYSLLSTPTSPFAKSFNTVIYAILDKAQVDIFKGVMEGGITDKVQAQISSICQFGSEKPQHKKDDRNDKGDRRKDNKDVKHRNSNKDRKQR